MKGIEMNMRLSEASDSVIRAWLVAMGVDANEIPKGATKMPWPWRTGAGRTVRPTPDWYDGRLAWLVAELRCSQPETQMIMYPMMLDQYGKLAVSCHDLAVGCGDPDGADAMRKGVLADD